MRHWHVVALASFSLTACGELPIGGLGEAKQEEAQTEITVTSDNVVLRGPQGFCVDHQSSKTKASNAFVVFGNCAAIAGDKELPQPLVNAIATATVLSAGRKGPSISDSSDALADFFGTDAGKATLSASGNASSVEILDSFTRDDAFFVHARDKSAPVLAGTDNTYWRGYFEVKNSIVALSVLGLKDAPVSSEDGLRTLTDFGKALKSDQAPKTSPDVANTGLLRRILG